MFVQIINELLNMTPQQALKHVIHLHGGQIAFAAALTKSLKKTNSPRVISQQIVSYWTRSPLGIPSKFCIATEELPKVNFKITKHMLRPDVFGDIPYHPIEEVA